MPETVCRGSASVVSGVNAGIDRIDIFKHLSGAPAAHKLHSRLSRKAGQRLGPVPGIRHQRGAKARFDLVNDFNHLAQAALRPVGTDAFLALNGVATEPGSPGHFFAGGAQRLGNFSWGKEPTVRVLDQCHLSLPYLSHFLT
ncbi:hypothetical protein BQ8794_140329 [Mesorhizobium prunaredense]|uniref:Uncharacterized protein n=1 Tax=Mesorhizobium prunaredense TaxID=1631249 RepID=A0A1R3V2R3_9HYPH|nr:hypothetical protein BQ8794_140329 [Mesorhizobium prunaredense]